MIYYDLCKECEYLFHCFGAEVAEKIQNEKVELHPGSCADYYPEIKQ